MGPNSIRDEITTMTKSEIFLSERRNKKKKKKKKKKKEKKKGDFDEWLVIIVLQKSKQVADRYRHCCRCRCIDTRGEEGGRGGGIGFIPGWKRNDQYLCVCPSEC